MCRILLLISTLALPAVAIAAEEPTYPSDVTKWQEAVIPPDTDRGERMVWSYAANYSNHGWRVFADGDHIYAQLTKERVQNPKPRPTFIPRAGQFRKASAFAAVDDGWLVGFNQGEFGAALYWFSADGQRNYKISDHQVVDFFSLPEGLHAIEGLAHMGMSVGSIVRIARPRPTARWHASSVVKLPYAPYAVSVRRDGTMLVTLSDALVAIGSDRKVRTLLAEAPWDGLYPNSSLLSRDETNLYIGMRQFVGEFDLATKKLRMLVPSDLFLNRLPSEEADVIRKQYDGSQQ